MPWSWPRRWNSTTAGVFRSRSSSPASLGAGPRTWPSANWQSSSPSTFRRTEDKMPYLSSNNVRLHYQQFGEGHDVVLIHALTSNLAVWLGSPLVYALAEQVRVTLYDLRGH